jgi:hypothetical protein
LKTPKQFKPILSVLLLSPILTELVSNNLPARAFLNPIVFLYLATIVYGFPVLLLREFACRKRMGIPGMLCLGLVYGIVNEGIFAKTFYLYDGVPINTFDHYGYVAGICVPWAITISVWHAFHAFLYPVLATYYLFPAHRDEPWLTRKSTIWVAVPTVLMGALVFFTRSKQRVPGHLPHFVLMLACMGILLWLATKAPRTALPTGAASSFRLQPMLWGLTCFPILFMVPVVLAKFKVNPILFAGLFAIAIALMVWWLNRRATIPLVTCLFFVIGDELMMVVWALPGSLGRAGIVQLITDVLLVVGFGLVFERLRKESLLQTATGELGAD